MAPMVYRQTTQVDQSTQAQCRDVVLQSAVAIPGLQHLLTSQESKGERWQAAIRTHSTVVIIIIIVYLCLYFL